MAQKYFAHATIRAQEDEDGNASILGQAVEYMRVGYFGWGFRLALAPDSANDALAARKDSPDRDALALIAHDPARVLGRTNTGTLRFAPTSAGIDYEIDVNMADSEAVSAYEKVKRGEFTAASIGFYIVESHEEVLSDNSLDAEAPDVDVNVEVADEIDIIEVSVLAHGAFGGATSRVAANAHYQISATPKDLKNAFITPREAEELATEDIIETQIGEEEEVEAETEDETEGEVAAEGEIEVEEEEESSDDSDSEDEVESEEQSELEVEDETQEESDSDSEDITEDDGEGDTVSRNESQDGTDSGHAEEAESETDGGGADDGDDSDDGDTDSALSFQDARFQAADLGLIDLLPTKEDNDA